MVLIIEDHADSRAMLRQFLEHRGAHVIEAEDGHAALIRLRTVRPDVILCDLLMPELDGLAFARRLRALPHHAETPLIAVTALGGEADFLETWAHDFDGHLTKPVDPDQLVRAIHRVRAARRPQGPST